MSHKPAFALILVFLVGGAKAWPIGPRTDIFIPVDALIAEQRYTEAIDMLQGLLISAPNRTKDIKSRIAKTQLLQADNDINSQRYNEALSALSLLWAQDPEQADHALKRIRKINQVREEYNKKAKDLLAFMSSATNRSDPSYNGEVRKRLQQLDDIDRNNPESKKTITGLEETFVALSNMDTMKTVMSAGRALIDAGEYAKAMREYLKGRDLFKPQFEKAGFDALTVQAISNQANRAEAIPDAYESAQSRLTKAVADLGAAFESGAPDKVEAVLPAAKLALEELRGLRETLFTTGISLARSYISIPKEGKSPIQYQYPSFLDIFLRGRPDSFGPDKKPDAEKGKLEGIGGALLAQSDKILDGLGKEALASVDRAYDEAEKNYDNAAYSEAEAAFSRTLALVEPGTYVLAGWELIPESDFIPDLADLRAKIKKGAIAERHLARLGPLAAAGQRLAGLASRYVAAASASADYIARLGADLPLKDVLAVLYGHRDTIRAIEASIKVEASGKAGLADQSAVLDGGDNSSDDRLISAFSAYSARLDKAIAAALASEYAVAAARGGVEGDYIERELAARIAAMKAAEDLIAGFPSPRPERARAGYRDPSPTNALLALDAEAPKQAALIDWISGELASMEAETAALKVDPPFSAARARIEDLGKKAAELQARRAAAIASASEKKNAAVAALTGARQDIDAAKARLADAKTLIAQNKGKGTKLDAIKKNFADSRDRLDQGLTKIVESSNQDFEAKTWDDFQNLYSSLNADINQTKKDYVIAETFRLLGEGETYYEQALFDLASESLNNAQDLWHEDNDSDQAQVKFWQNQVRQASDTNNKREVRQSDTLYYEVGSYLSEARKFYIKGDGLMKSGHKAEAGAAFDSAQQNISYITRAFPLNAEAGLLTLQILKSTDPEAYKISLPRRIQEATALLASDGSLGYSRLADLYKMEPNYPGLKASLEKAEIMVGKRRAPPTKQDLATAAAYLADAGTLLKTGRKDDATKAESDLNAALTYDPTNKKALALLQDLKTLQGKTAGPSLGLADKAVLDQATRSFAASQYNQARDQLSQLLSDPGTRTRDVLKLDNDLKTLGY
jgi:hypothetical protein